jgi:hypothetical protein
MIADRRATTPRPITAILGWDVVGHTTLEHE